MQRIQGAVAAYIFIGLMFSSVYELFVVLRPTAFTFSVRPPDESPHALSAQLVYFSFVTLTTVGYGDVTPVNPMLRSMVTVEALIGQLFPQSHSRGWCHWKLYYSDGRTATESRSDTRQCNDRTSWSTRSGAAKGADADLNHARLHPRHRTALWLHASRGCR